MLSDSTNNQPPDFGPGLPVYPPLAQLVRVTSPSIGGNVYPAITQQWAPPLSLRDREPCYVIEPNKIPLGPGYYDCRLVSSFQGLPLYATTCCPGGSFASSSSSSGSSASLFASGIQRISLGADTSGGALQNVFTIPGVSVLGGMLELVVGTVGGNATNPVSATYGTMNMIAGPQANLPGGSPFAAAFRLYSCPVSDDMQTVTFTVAFSGTTAFMVLLVNVTGLVSNAQENTAAASGLASAPDTGATTMTLNDSEYVQGGFLFTPSSSYSWTNSFIDAQTVAMTVSGVSFLLLDAYRILSSKQIVDAALSGVTPAAWGGAVGTYP